jgi:hypothetical protein
MRLRGAGLSGEHWVEEDMGRAGWGLGFVGQKPRYGKRHCMAAGAGGWGSVDPLGRWGRSEAAGKGKARRKRGMLSPNGNPVDAPNPLPKRTAGMAFLYD